MSAALIGAIVGGTNAIGQGYLGAKGAKDAAKAKRKAEMMRQNTIRQALLQTQNWSDANLADIAPYHQMGQQAMQSHYQRASQGVYDQNPFSYNMLQDPGYQFAMQEGLKGVNRGLSGSGMRFSGAGDKARMRYAEGLASQRYQQGFNRATTQYGLESNRLSGMFNRDASLGALGERSLGAILGERGRHAGVYTNLIGALSGSQAAMGQHKAEGILGKTQAYQGALGGLASSINQGMSNQIQINQRQKLLDFLLT